MMASCPLRSTLPIKQRLEYALSSAFVSSAAISLIHVIVAKSLKINVETAVLFTIAPIFTSHLLSFADHQVSQDERKAHLKLHHIIRFALCFFATFTLFRYIGANLSAKEAYAYAGSSLIFDVIIQKKTSMRSSITRSLT